MPTPPIHARRPQSGATLIEFVYTAPIILAIIFGIIQFGMFSHAKSQVNYATFQTARMASKAGDIRDIDLAKLNRTFEMSIMGYFGGGDTKKEMEHAFKRVSAHRDAKAILITLDKQSSKTDITVNVIFGIPPEKQMPLLGKPLRELWASFNPRKPIKTMLEAGYLPVNSSVTMQMADPAREELPADSTPEYTPPSIAPIPVPGLPPFST